MKLKNYLFTLVLLTSAFASRSTILGGVINTNTTITATGNPYYVTSDLQIANSATYTIDPGVEMYFYDGIQFKIAGTLRAMGTTANPIIMTRDAGATAWNGLIFYNNASDSDSNGVTGCVLKNCTISYTGNLSLIVQCYNTMLIDSCNFQNFETGVEFNQGGYFYHSSVYNDLYWAFNTNLGIGTSYIKYNEFYGLVSSGNATITINDAVVEHNLFHHNNGDLILRVADYSVIRYNEFTENYNAAALYLLGGTNHIIYKNYFNNNKIHLKQQCDRYADIQQNCFGNYGQYALYITQNYEPPYIPYDCNAPSVTTSVYMGNNSFFAASTQIDAAVFDVNDDVSNVYSINYLPVNTTACNGYDAINENDLSSFIHVYPNPAHDNITIETGNTPVVQCALFSSLGQPVIQVNDLQSKNMLSVGHLPNGIYTVRITTGNGVFSKKIIRY